MKIKCVKGFWSKNQLYYRCGVFNEKFFGLNERWYADGGEKYIKDYYLL